MRLEAGLLALVKSLPEVRAALGEDAACRIYPVVLPQKSWQPVAMTYQCVSTVPEWDLKGPNGVAFKRVQFDVWAAASDSGGGYATAKRVAAAVRRMLDGHRGRAGDVELILVEIDGERDGAEADGLVYRVTFDVGCTYRER